MKKLSQILFFYAGIPFLACIPGFVLNLAGLSSVNVVLVPLLTAAIYWLIRKKQDLQLAAMVNGTALLGLLSCFTLMMVISKGAVEGVLMTNFSWLIFPFAPIMLILLLMGKHLLLFAAAFLTYAAAFAVCAFLSGMKLRKAMIPTAAAALACIFACTGLYLNRPAAKYSGHGFAYMNGWSSTDFSDYMVYSKDSRLAEPSKAPSFMIEKAEDMPVMDGAEACYPLYAAFAKALYKDIDVIEENWKKDHPEDRFNGHIVTFTNSVNGFSSLLVDGKDPEKYGRGVDMFFGARPSQSQLQMARDYGIELEITPIGREAFVFFAEEGNPISDLSSDQLKAIYHGDITNWNQLGGADQKILAFQRPRNSGSQTMMEYFMGDLSLKEPLSYEMVDAMSGVISRVAEYANEKGAIGYSFRYFLEELNQEKGVRMLSVDGVYPSLEHIENGSYPLTTSVCLVTRKDDPDPNVQKVKEYILSEEGQEILRKTGYAGLAE